MGCLKYIVIQCLFLNSTFGYHLNVRNKFVSEILSNFRIRYCVWLLDLNDVLLSKKMKTVSRNNIFTVAMEEDDLSKYLNDNEFLPTSEAVIGDLDSLEWSRFIAQSYHSSKMAKMTWIIFFTGDWEALSRIYIPYNCMFLLAYQESDGYGLYEIYQLKGRHHYADLGFWSKTTGLDISQQPFYDRRLNFFGTELTMLCTREDASNEYENAHKEIWYSMGYIMNFSTRLITNRELKKENNWITLDVSDQVTVFHATGLLKDPYLLYSIAPIWKVSMYIYIRREDDRTAHWESFIRPFSNTVWCMLALTLFLSSVSIVIIYGNRSFLHIVEMAFSALDSISNQCGSYVGRKYSKRIATAITRMLAICLVPAYSGVIISILTLRYPIFPFTDLKGLVDDGTFKLGSVNTSFGLGYFEYSQNPLSQKIAKELFVDQAIMPTNFQEGFTRSCSENFAFLAPSDAVENINLSCPILRLPTPAFTTFAGMHLMPYSEFKSIFFRNLMRLKSAGIVNKLSQKRELQEIESHDHIEVTLDHIYPLLLLILVGTFLSIIILAVEVGFANVLKKRTPSRPRHILLYRKQMEKLLMEIKFNKNVKPCKRNNGIVFLD